MLHCYVVMEVTDEKKGIFLFYSRNINKKFSKTHFHYSGLNVSIKIVDNQ